MSDLLTELDDAMRQERMEKLWRDHGKSFLGLLALIILATAAFSGYRAWDESVKSAGTAQLMALMESPDFPNNITGAEFKMRAGLKGITLLTAAGTHINQGEKEQALALYDTAATDKSIPDDIRDLATLMRVRLLANEDAHEPLLTALKPIAYNNQSPWRHHAHLEMAVLYAHGAADFTKAREHTALVMEAQNLPQTLYTKAQALDHVYALKQTRQPKADQDS